MDQPAGPGAADQQAEQRRRHAERRRAALAGGPGRGSLRPRDDLRDVRRCRGPGVGRPARHQRRPAPARTRAAGRGPACRGDGVVGAAAPRRPARGLGRVRRRDGRPVGRRGEGRPGAHAPPRCGPPSTRSCRQRCGPSGRASTASRCTAHTATWSPSSSTAGSNHREDGYGGSVDDRSRFLHEILEGIRQSTGPDFQLGLRLSPERFGIDLGEATALAGAGDVRRAPRLPGPLAVGRPEAPARAGRTTVCCSTTSPRCRGTACGWATRARSCRPRTSRGAWTRAPTSSASGRARSSTTTSPTGWSATGRSSATRSRSRRAHLEAESVGPAFIDYLATNWDDFVR